MLERTLLLLGRLLKSMLDAAPALRLVEVEGDALFLAAPLVDGRESDGSSGDSRLRSPCAARFTGSSSGP
jgi:hypothetical protein